MRNNVTHGFEISRKVLCLLLTVMLLIQTGCQTTHVLQTVEREEQKTNEPKLLELKFGQLVRIIYQKGSSSEKKHLIGRVKSATSDVLVVLYKGRQVRLSFDVIEKIEIVEEEPFAKKNYIVVAACALPPIIFIFFVLP